MYGTGMESHEYAPSRLLDFSPLLQVPGSGQFFLLDKGEIGIHFRIVKKAAQRLSGERLVNTTLSTLPNFSTQFILIDRVLAGMLPFGCALLILHTKVSGLAIQTQSSRVYNYDESHLLKLPYSTSFTK